MSERTMHAPAAGEDVRDSDGRVWSVIRSALDRATLVNGDYEEVSARLDEIARECERKVAALLRAPRGDGEAGTWGDTPFAAFVVWWQQRFGDVFIDPRVWCYTKAEEAHLAAQRLKENGVPVVLAVAPAALRSEAPGEKEARDVGYMLGVLHAAEHVFGHGQDLIAAELVDEIMDGFGARRVKDLAKAESVEIRWSEVNAVRADRRGEGGGE